MSSKHRYSTSPGVVGSSHRGLPSDTHRHSFSMSQLFPIFCAPQNRVRPVGIRPSTTKLGLSSGW